MPHVEDLVATPDEIAKRVAEHLHRLSRDTLSDELVYTPFGKDSYYRDLVLGERAGDKGALERLKRHGEQVGALHELRERRAWERLQAGPFEYRVTPDRTDGYGGYFAPPAWLNEMFATANRPGRVLAGLMPKVALPPGVSEINVPVIETGTVVQPATDDTPVVDQDLTDSAASSQVVPFAGQADVALQLLEQSPVGAHLDWAIFMDLTEAYDFDLESQLIYGIDGTSTSLRGVTQVTGINTVTYTSASPTGSKMWPYLSQLPASIGKTRRKPPECWMMTTARWCYFQGSEDAGERPFGLSPVFIGKDNDTTPDPIGGLMGWPVFLNDAIPTNLGTGGKQDQVLCLRPRDLILLEGAPQTLVAREPLSGALGVRLQMHCNAAALTGRRPAGIGVLEGTGMTVQSGY